MSFTHIILYTGLPQLYLSLNYQNFFSISTKLFFSLPLYMAIGKTFAGKPQTLAKFPPKSNIENKEASYVIHNGYHNGLQIHNMPFTCYMTHFKLPLLIKE